MNETWSYNWDRLAEKYVETPEDVTQPEYVWMADVDTDIPDGVSFRLFDDLLADDEPVELEF